MPHQTHVRICSEDLPELLRVVSDAAGTVRPAADVVGLRYLAVRLAGAIHDAAAADHDDDDYNDPGFADPRHPAGKQRSCAVPGTCRSCCSDTSPLVGVGRHGDAR